MKTAITATGNSLESTIDQRFGRCAYFVVYESENRSIEFIPNPNKDTEDGAGPLSVKVLASRNVRKIVSGEFGMKIKPLLDSLKTQMIVIQDPEKKIKEIIEMLNHKKSGEDINMKIAVPTIGGILDEYLSKCEVFTIFTVDELNKIVDSELLYTPEGCDCKNNIPLIMQQKGVTVMLAYELPEHADGECSKHGITPFLGYSGNVKDVVESFLKQKTIKNPEG